MTKHISPSIQKISRDNYKLIHTFSVNPNSCDNPAHYEDYLKYNALNDANSGMGVTYLLIDEDNQTLMGFFSIKTTAFIKKSYGHEGKMDLGFPALEIAELAVHKDYERQHIGSDILDIVFAFADELRSIVGIQYVVLCADPKAKDFYSNSNYKFSQIDSLEDLPREDWNSGCVPMYVKLPEM